MQKPVARLLIQESQSLLSKKKKNPEEWKNGPKWKVEVNYWC